MLSFIVVCASQLLSCSTNARLNWPTVQIVTLRVVIEFYGGPSDNRLSYHSSRLQKLGPTLTSDISGNLMSHLQSYIELHKAQLYVNIVLFSRVSQLNLLKCNLNPTV